jgi:nucleoside-diphosphate-sugar epimerase
MDGGKWSASLVFVDNLVDGIIAAMDSGAAAGRTYNLRDDYDVTWKEYITWLGGLVGKKPMGSLPCKAAWRLGWIIQTALLPLGVRPPITAQAVGIMGTDNDVSNRRAKEELGWKTRVPWDEAKVVIEQWVHDEYKPPK